MPNLNDNCMSGEVPHENEDIRTTTTSHCPASFNYPENVPLLNSVASHLTDLSQLKAQANPKDTKPPRYTAESFKNTGEVQLANAQTSQGDPFSGIDPLWPLKRK